MNSPFIDVRSVYKTFIQGEHPINVLTDVSFTVAEGETIAIVGESGSGKSTLLSLLAGLDRPTSGSVIINGEDISRFSESELTAFRARTLGIVFQQFHLMSHLTALENVSLPLEIAERPNYIPQARAALTQVGLADRSTHVPAKLSGGERQRVAIARAFVTEPKLLLADEPSGNLDTESGLHVMRLLFDRVRERQMTLVLVTHNMELARQCNRILQLTKGLLRPAS